MYGDSAAADALERVTDLAHRLWSVSEPSDAAVDPDAIRARVRTLARSVEQIGVGAGCEALAAPFRRMLADLVAGIFAGAVRVVGVVEPGLLRDLRWELLGVPVDPEFVAVRPGYRPAPVAIAGPATLQ